MPRVRAFEKQQVHDVWWSGTGRPHKSSPSPVISCIWIGAGLKESSRLHPVFLSACFDEGTAEGVSSDERRYGRQSCHHKY
jgi:hypothetical protein